MAHDLLILVVQGGEGRGIRPGPRGVRGGQSRRPRTIPCSAARAAACSVGVSADGIRVSSIAARGALEASSSALAERRVEADAIGPSLHVSVPVTGPEFVSLQVRDLDASQAFYERFLGLERSPAGPPHAVVFTTTPIAFALRGIVEGTDLDAGQHPGLGVALWLHATDVRAICDALVADGHAIATAPFDGLFGRTFAFVDPDGYRVTLHDHA